MQYSAGNGESKTRRRVLPLKDREQISHTRGSRINPCLSSVYVPIIRKVHAAATWPPLGQKLTTESGKRSAALPVFHSRDQPPFFLHVSDLRLLNRSWVNGEPIRTVLAIFRASGTTRSTA